MSATLSSQIVRNESDIREEVAPFVNQFTDYLIQHEAVDLTTRQKTNAMGPKFKIDYLIQAVKERGHTACTIFLRGLEEVGLTDLALKISNTELMSHKIEKLKVVDRLEQLEQRNTLHEEKQKKLESDIQALKLENQTKTESIDELRRENRELQKKNEMLDAEIHNFKQQMEKMKTETETKTTDFEKKIALLNSENATLRLKLEIAENKNKDQERTINAILKQQLTTKSKMKESYESKMYRQRKPAFGSSTTPRVLPPITKGKITHNPPKS